ncbi:hypothetical protein CASFOL_038158 [Castilleja foliolosa]|uniref:Peptidase S54 rhomboid domain-containing protein n=1 Tax=Castilleja foliolosa TaxID=1961234 RepID=A0ABD3BM55_9LAMI
MMKKNSLAFMQQFSSSILTSLSSFSVRRVRTKFLNEIYSEVSNGKAVVRTLRTLKELREDAVYWVEGTITGADINREFCYLACRICGKKVEEVDGKKRCMQCGEYTFRDIFRYNVEVVVADESDSAKLILWNRASEKLISEPAEDVIALYGDTARTMPDDIAEKFLGREGLTVDEEIKDVYIMKNFPDYESNSEDDSFLVISYFKTADKIDSEATQTPKKQKREEGTDHKYIWRLRSSNGVRNGFFSSPVFARRFFLQTLVKGQTKSPVSSAVRNFSRRYFHLPDSQHRHHGCCTGLVTANVAVFILWRVGDTQFMLNNFSVSVGNFTSGRIHTMITCAFSHRDMWHLISNMLVLCFCGPSIGATFGPGYLLKLYLSGAVFGSIYHLGMRSVFSPSFQNQQMCIDPSKFPGLGTSGAMNAIALFYLYIFPTKTIMAKCQLFLLATAVMFYDAYNVIEALPEVKGVFGSARQGVSGYAHQGVSGYAHQVVDGITHLGGDTVAAMAWAWCGRHYLLRRF